MYALNYILPGLCKKSFLSFTICAGDEKLNASLRIILYSKVEFCSLEG